jgi:hypothetical protein
MFKSIDQTQIAREESITTIVVVKFGMISKPYGGSHMKATRGKQLALHIFGPKITSNMTRLCEGKHKLKHKSQRCHQQIAFWLISRIAPFLEKLIMLGG